MSNLRVNQVTADAWFNQDGTENFKCRAWLNMDVSTGVPVIKAGGNVSSIVDNGVGDFTANFVKALPSANYAPAFSWTGQSNYAPAVKSNTVLGPPVAKLATSLRFVLNGGNGTSDPADMSLMVFGG